MDWDETLARVRSAAELCAQGNLACVRIEDGSFAVTLRRTVREARPAAVAQPTSTDGIRQNGAVDHPEMARSLLRAEFVGIVHFARPAVVPGTVLSEDRELAYVESLGIRNPIHSGGPGRVAEVFVAEGQPVDFGQTLFSIENA
ncbi:MAG: acetyl-CoA carboxylase biotin carboxyl carrier protein subunit [Candidatus Eremiobacteraeota bacterium]|nr:acetyl-CoA carboxylase biotin carboxyl carrier protein subunit [Candidatus Eremiobacteraeota bacterium]MBC5802005.1 acetyl-CoA carboxylase biotin carboxyl carrier protein subunit [Candidatus Eremiobacteraeota bacterium]MBC5820395.1 acetyl-CoA carboxylase biotin carboxyl carrier protein subunit [Candidatus Eremiobacteraeota bacterium]